LFYIFITGEPSDDEDSDIEIVPAEELNEGNESTQFPINFEELYDLTRANDYDHLIIPGPSSNQLAVGRDSHEGKKNHILKLWILLVVSMNNR